MFTSLKWEYINEDAADNRLTVFSVNIKFYCCDLETVTVKIYL